MHEGKHEPFDPEELTRRLNEYLAERARLRTRAKLALTQPYMIRAEQILLNFLKEVYQWAKSRGFADQPSKSRLPLSTTAYFPVVY